MCVLLLSSCTKIGTYAEERADRAAYGNIRGAQLSGFGESDEFTIGDNRHEMVQRLLELDESQLESEVLSLTDTLIIAMANSRSYQFQKEALFIEALSLSEIQKDFNWNYDASASAETSYTSMKDGTAETFGDNGVDSSFGVSIGRTLVSGAKVSLGFSQNLLSYFTNPNTSSENNALSFNIVQPLLNGFGPLVTKEPLRQAERDMVYAVREFKRYQQDFVIDTTEQYYSTLQSRDQLINVQKNYEASVVNRARSESYAKAGRIAAFAAAQAKQSELDAADSWALSKASYDKALDDYRYSLGLPVELNVIPDTNELQRLVIQGLVEIDINFDEAMTYALSNRLDLVTKREQVEDHTRQVEIQQRNFLPNLSVSYNAEQQFDSSDGGDISQNLGVSLDLPFDWTEKRNAFRIAQISLEREIRALDEDESDVVRTVRDLWRKLERNRSVYKNRMLSVTLSERRVENTQLLLKQGKAETRDLLDAEDDLLSSQNDTTTALIDYTINRLNFWNEIERFEIDPKGMWYGKNNEEETVATP